MRGRGLTGVTMLAIVAGITGAWWALALWPVGEGPAWLERTRYVCFGTRVNGLPDAAGWTALILQPALMIAAIGVIWGRSLLDGLRRLRIALPVGAAAIGAGLVAAGWRVAGALDDGGIAGTATTLLPSTYARLDRPAPALDLVDQHGDTVALADLEGGVTLVTFAFAHCETMCPAIVQDVVRARRRIAQRRAARAVVVTLDPWRDVPSRLPAIARAWGLGEGERILSGPVPVVEAVLDAWGVARQRDPRTGDVIHPPAVFLVGPEGTIAYASTGGVEHLVALAERM